MLHGEVNAMGHCIQPEVCILAVLFILLYVLFTLDVLVLQERRMSL